MDRKKRIEKICELEESFDDCLSFVSTGVYGRERGIGGRMEGTLHCLYTYSYLYR